MLARAVMDKVLVVGTGVTGAVTAALLQGHLPDKAQVLLWDKSRGAGGRMSTSRSPKDGNCTVDLGAQYISATPEYYQSHNKFYSELEKEGLLEPLTGFIDGEKSSDQKHFTTPNGISSVAKYFIKKSGAEVRYNQQVADVSQVGDQWKVTCQDGTSDVFDCVVLTMPVPQILQLRGSVANLIESQPDVKSSLSSVSYSARFAVGLFYEPGTNIDVPWCAKYVNNDPCIRYIAVDNKKRNRVGGDVSPSIAVHTSVPFGLQHLEEDKETVGTEHILPRLQALLPSLPQPAAVKHHKWRYSQIHRPYPGSPGALVLQQSPLLVCGGDAFTFSKFDGCIESALKISEIVTGKSIAANL